MANVGNGHIASSNALKYEIEQNYSKDYDVKILDLFEEADVEPFNSSNQSYSLVSKNYFLEGLNNFLFRSINTNIGYSIFYRYVKWRMLTVCKEIMSSEKPDIVISTHPIVSTIINQIKLDIGLNLESNFKSYVVISDLVTMFRPWADDSADLIFTPTQESSAQLQNFGVDAGKIQHPYFPVRRSLQNLRTKQEILSELNFAKEKPIILVTGGGVGGHSLTKTISKLISEDKYNLIIIAGRLEYFKEELELKYGSRDNLRVFGYVNNINEYFSISDLVIGKPGPNTIVELELFEKKAIFTKVVGEQEKGNVWYIKNNPNFRYIGDNHSVLVSKIEELMSQDYIKYVSQRRFEESKEIVEKIILHSQS